MTTQDVSSEITEPENRISEEYTNLLQEARNLGVSCMNKSSSRTTWTILAPILCAVAGFVLCGLAHPAFVIMGIVGVLIAIFGGRAAYFKHNKMISEVNTLNSVIDNNLSL